MGTLQRLSISGLLCLTVQRSREAVVLETIASIAIMIFQETEEHAYEGSEFNWEVESNT